MIPVETHDYTVYGDGYAEWDHYPHETTSEYMRGDYVRTKDADAAYDALTAERDEARHQASILSEAKQEIIDGLEASLAAQGQLIARLKDALNSAAEELRRNRPSGHAGDEETGEHYEDCELCAHEAVMAQIDAALSPDPAPPTQEGV